jgi:hypothetical protein
VNADAQASERMQAINAAWELLSNPQRRRAWDEGHTEVAWARPKPAVWTPWTAAMARAATAAPATSSGPGWWLALAFVMLLLISVLGVGVAGALGRDPGPDVPYVQDNLDRP